MSICLVSIFLMLGDAQNPQYKELHLEKGLTLLEQIKNIRPMSRLPIAKNLGEESAALWATDDLGCGVLAKNTTNQVIKLSAHWL